MASNENDKSMRSVLALCRIYFFVSDLKVISLFNRLVFLKSSFNKLAAVEVKKFLCPEI